MSIKARWGSMINRARERVDASTARLEREIEEVRNGDRQPTQFATLADRLEKLGDTKAAKQARKLADRIRALGN